ncbi:hypothetical protein niasHS_016023 [Heterodera schachtii]|uniref:RING-type domain-containing protein n=1 Tax=Heterodera schachtii TaxID=97005 RepID=A0ABD2HP19_HETSC
MDDIRTMVRRNNFVIHEPNMSMVYTFNLGKIDPPGLLWKRKIFVLPENDLGNYHAFLYAVAYKNQRTQDNLNSKIRMKLLGYAPFVKIDNEIAPTMQTDDKRLNEYQLTIPIDASNLFKQYILSLNLVIYSYEKNNNYDETLDTKNAIHTNECPICLETLNSEKQTMQLHDDYQHIFHNDCIIKWVKQQQLIRCPLCNREAKFIKNAQVKVSFDVSTEMSPPFFYMDPLAHLFRLANGQTADDCQFKINQAKLLLKQFIDQIMTSGEEQLKRMVSEADFLNIKFISGQKLFEIGPNGLHENKTVNKIQKELENMLYSKENVSAITIKNTVTMFEIIGKIRNLNVSAQSFLDGMQHITMEKALEEF